MVLVQVALEVVYRELIATFIASVVLAVHLNRVIREMYVPGMQVRKIKLLRRGSEVAVSVHIALQFAIDGCYECVATDIKFSIVD